MNRSLFQIDFEQERILAEIENYCIENETDEVPQELLDQLEINREDFEQKVEAYHFRIEEWLGDLDTLKKYEERIKAKKKSIQNNIDRLKLILGQSLERYGNKTESGSYNYKTPLFSVTARRSQVVFISDPEEIPEIYKVYKDQVMIDKKLIAKDLKDGLEVTGAVLDTSKINITFR